MVRVSRIQAEALDDDAEEMPQGGLKLQEGVKMDINHFLPSLH